MKNFISRETIIARVNAIIISILNGLGNPEELGYTYVEEWVTLRAHPLIGIMVRVHSAEFCGSQAEYAWHRSGEWSEAIRRNEEFEYNREVEVDEWWKYTLAGPVSTRLALFTGDDQCPTCSSNRYFQDSDDCLDCGR